jgi:hypothetical protein
MEFYSNSMLFNYFGQYDPSGDDIEEHLEYPTETTYVQCQTCKHYVHPAHGVIDTNINEFFCNECETEYQQNHKND